MNPIILLTTLVAYLLGSIAFSVLVARLFGLGDVRAGGSGHAGARNTLRQAGLLPAILVGLLDVGKGFAAVTIAQTLVPGSTLAVMLAGIAVVVGHNWPVFFGFKGGMGLASGAGAVWTHSLILPFIAIATVLPLMHAIKRYRSRAVNITLLTLPVWLWLLRADTETWLLTLGSCGVIFARYLMEDWHREYVPAPE